MSSSRKIITCRLYLVQHGQAEQDSSFSGRPLSEVGKNTTEHAAAWAARIGLGVDEIWHSGKYRAKQTAEIFAKKLQPIEGVTAHEGMEPNDDVVEFAKLFDNLDRSLMLVGHLPYLARLAGLLLSGDPEKNQIRFFNSGIVGLERQDDRWMIFCVIPPGIYG